jgi:3-methyladenine DNA glycosylase Tag
MQHVAIFDSASGVKYIMIEPKKEVLREFFRDGDVDSPAEYRESLAMRLLGVREE